MLKRSDFEIMAPVGSRESLYAAIQAHADAVYFGLKTSICLPIRQKPLRLPI